MTNKEKELRNLIHETQSILENLLPYHHNGANYNCNGSDKQEIIYKYYQRLYYAWLKELDKFEHKYF